MAEFFLMFTYFWERQRQNASGLGAEREGDTESEAGSSLWAVSIEPNAGLKLTSCEITARAEVGRSTDWATQAPQMFIYFWERDRDREWVGEGREGKTQNSKQAPGSELSAQSPMRSSNPWILRSWPELKPHRLSQPGVPPHCICIGRLCWFVIFTL